MPCHADLLLASTTEGVGSPSDSLTNSLTHSHTSSLPVVDSSITEIEYLFETFQAIDICKTDSSQVQDKIDVLSKVWGRWGPADGTGGGVGVGGPANDAGRGGWCVCGKGSLPAVWRWEDGVGHGEPANSVEMGNGVGHGEPANGVFPKDVGGCPTKRRDKRGENVNPSSTPCVNVHVSGMHG